MPPETRYAKSGDVNIAYQVVGEGPFDLVLVHGWVQSFDAGWEIEPIERFYQRLASFSRLILFDKRGVGLSDRVPPDNLPSLETRMDDMRAVMDEVGVERAALLGHSEGGAMCALFAATYPERTRALVMSGSAARTRWAPDYPLGFEFEDRGAHELKGVPGEWRLYCRLHCLRRSGRSTGPADRIRSPRAPRLARIARWWVAGSGPNSERGQVQSTLLRIEGGSG